MIEFTYLFLFRCLSGAQNGFGYANNQPGLHITTGLMVAAIGLLFAILFPVTGWLGWAAIGWLIVSLVGTVGVWDSFIDQVNFLTKDIHFWELWTTAGVLLAWISAGGNLIYIAASVYPSLIIHKGFINMGNNLSFFDERTDDRTGKTFSVPILGIKIPRLGIKARIAIAVVSILLVVINSTLLRLALRL